MPAFAAVRRQVLAHLVLAVTLALTITLLAAPTADAGKRKKIKRAVEIARNQKGDPYSYGATGPNAFDCSGLTYFAYHKRSNMRLPRTSGQQAKFSRRIKKRNLRRGDFMFFYDGSARAGNVYHMGIYVGRHHGKRYIFHSSRSGVPVQRDPVWTRQWFAGTLRGR